MRVDDLGGQSRSARRVTRWKRHNLQEFAATKNMGLGICRALRLNSGRYLLTGSGCWQSSRQWSDRRFLSSDWSRALRFRPLGRIRIPNRISPRMTGSTAISPSCVRSHSITRRSGLGFVGLLKTFARTKDFTTRPLTQKGWVQRNLCKDKRAAKL